MGYSKILDQILNNRPVSHILYWIATVVISISYGIGYGEPIELAIILEKIALPIQIIATYIFIYIQLPLLYRKKYWVFFISFLIFSYIFHILMHVSNDLWFGKDVISYHTNHTFEQILQSGEYYLTYSVDIYLVVFITAGIKLIKDNLENKKKFEILEAEKAKKEYQYLQSRIQPEFLLNTLQLIENQSTTNNTLAAESIADLSEVLDYSLYKSDKSEISVSAEFRQMKLLAKLLVFNLETIENIHTTESNLLDTIKVKPMSLTKIIESSLVYINQINTDKKTLTFETTAIEGSILFDMLITGISTDEINISKLKIEIEKNSTYANLDIDVHRSNNGSNLQIKLN